jgi:ribosome-associated protein
MNDRIVNASLLFPELDFTASRSGGPGGQNVNKVNSKISVRFDVPRSEILTEGEKELILLRLGPHLTKTGVLQVIAQENRSQLENKQAVIAKLDALLAKAFEKRKARKKSKPSHTAVQKRIQAKKHVGEKKKWRQKPD